ncbi:MAG: hypothetical protein LBQ59_03510 [Candidatus Peribacteria bacterium]|jgi:hypothetical protein|nr:hypothetical protein [Candidatus Peribacteria bacterium]
MNNNQGKDKLSELLYTKMINSSLSFLGDDNLKNGIDKFFNNPKFYVEKDNVIFIFNGNLF